MTRGESIDYTAIDHVQLAMPPGREEDARRFYVEVLGLREVAKPDELAGRGGCWFTSLGGTVHVHLGADPDFRPATKAHPALVTRDLDALRRRLVMEGAAVTDDASIGVRRFYASDPFGNRIEFVDEKDRGFTNRDWSGS